MSGQVLVANKATKIPPFLKKLVDLTNSCPPHIGGWNEDGTHFVVRSSQFADLLREQFQGTLQTFVRQLHFYSFTKKDDVSTGVWTFSHPHFLRGQAHLLVNIGRKSNPKRKKSKDDDDDAASEGSGDQSSKNNQMNAAVEARLVYLERQLTRMTSLERELQALKQEVTQFRELHAAQNLLSLAPGIARKRTADEADRKEVVTPISSQVMTSKVLEKEEALSMLPPLKKVTRMTSVDSAFEMKDFPFEDTSSLGSVSVRDLMRELQFGLFADFDEFMPVASKFTATDALVPATPMSDSSAELSGKAPCSMNKEDYFKIPKDFVFQPGVTRALLKQTFNVITKLVCPSTTEECPEALRRICEERPHPSSLPPVEVCEIANALLPYLKEGIEDKVEDIVLLRASRQVYEIFYACVQKKFQDLSGVSTQAHKQIPMQSGMQH